MSDNNFTSYMSDALERARKARDFGEVPVGAVVVHAGKIVGSGHNLTRTDHDPTAHAEIIAMRRAAQKLGTERLENCDLWVTLEPCAMCAGAIAHARIARLYYGASDEKGGAVESGVRFFQSPACHHKPEIYSGLEQAESAMILKKFFENRRD